MLLQQRMAADSSRRYAYEPRTDGGEGPGPGEADDGQPAGGPGAMFAAQLGIMVNATRSIERLATKLGMTGGVPWDIAHPIEIPGEQIPAAGTIQDPDRLGPQDGWAWRVFGVAIVLGTGATQFSVYYDSPNDPTNLVFQGTQSGRWEPSHFYLMPNRLLVYQSVGGGLTVGKGCAVEIAIPFLPAYMSK